MRIARSCRTRPTFGRLQAAAKSAATRHALPHVERQARTAVAELARPG
jgi:hypothetical protein